MVTCPRCEKEYDEMEALCPHCGTFNENRAFGNETVQLNRVSLNNYLESISQITALLQSDDTLVLQFGQAELSISLREKVIFGRDMSALGGNQLVDLEHFVGHQAGISRRHAELVCSANGDVLLTDLASSNGTFVNGDKLTALRPCALQDGDELMLGTLNIRLQFDED